jgi:uncharacterized membrane protein YbhN (UPF0104 family)
MSNPAVVRDRPPGLLAVLVGMATAAALIGLAVGVDGSALGRVSRALASDPGSLAAAFAAFGCAFALRSWAWRRVLPGLSFGHAWAGIHVALAGNHVLPLRLGEPLRVLSVARRAAIPVPPATATTVTLRAADLLSLVVVSLTAAPLVLRAGGVPWLDSAVVRVAVPAALTALLVVGLAWTWRLRAAGSARLPGPAVVAATMAAWLAESILTWVVAHAAGIDLSLAEAVLVSTAAVLSQLIAFTPGGIGTYEAAATAAYVALGVDPALGLAAAIVTHAVKTLYALAVGAVSLAAPAPSMFGRLRLPTKPTPRPQATTPVGGSQPVVLFLPAHEEAAIVASVVARAPTHIQGRDVVVVVVADGSDDDTAARAAAAGAIVIEHQANRGLGAAVRTGLEHALGYDPAAVAFCDADGEYEPAELERLVAPILAGRADYVVGSRFDGEITRMKPHRRLGNLVLTWGLRFVARQPISDGQSGYRALSPQAAAEVQIAHDFNYAQVMTLDLLSKGYRYTEVPISYAFRTTGTSFVRLGPYLRTVIPAVHRQLNRNDVPPSRIGRRFPTSTSGIGGEFVRPIRSGGTSLRVSGEQPLAQET